ncbi:MAG: YfhO family protein [Solirubrobacteraceae bacterium]
MPSAPTPAARAFRAGPRAPALERVLRLAAARPTLAAALVYALLSLLMVGQGLLPGRTLSSSDSLLSSVPWQSSKPADVPGLGTNFELADASNVFQPMLQYTRSQLPGVPLWNPYIMAGRPLLADGQSAVFSPFSVPSYVLPFWKSLAVAAMLKLFLGALGTFVLARVLGMRFGGALLSGVVFAFGTFFVVWLAWPLSSVYAFIGWTLALTELLVRRPARLTVAGLAAVVGLQFLGGHPESSFHLLFTTVVFFVFRALLHRHRAGAGARSLLAPTGAFVLALVAGTGLAALVLAPFAEFVLHSGDLAQRVNQAAGFWPRKYLGALFLHDYWGRPTQIDLESFMQVRGWYAGAVTLMLVAAALILRRSAERIAIVAYALFCVCMVVGIPPVFGIVSALPGFDAAHNERLLIYVLLSLGLLAGWGLDDLSALQLPSRIGRRAVIGAAGAIVCLPIAWMAVAGTLNLHELWAGLKVAWGFAHPPVPPAGVDAEFTLTGAIVRDSSLEIWLPPAAAGLALIAARLRSRRPLAVEVFVGLTVVLLAADLFRANMGFNPAIPIRNATPPVTGAIRYLQRQRPNRFIGVSTLELTQPLPADLAMHFGLYDARGYDFPVEKRLNALWRRDVAPGTGALTQPEEFASATPASLRALDLLSVSDLLVGPLQAVASPLRGPGLTVAYRGDDGVVYANADALPRVFVVDHQQTVQGDAAALDAVTAPGFDRRGVAVTEAPLAGLPQSTSAPAPAGAGARLASYGAERIVIHATATARSLVVLTDDSYPGWSATVDGRPATVRRVDYLLRGVSVGPGSHTIVFTYQPASWTIGVVITLLCALGLIAAAASVPIAARRRRADA